jgi:hypothetical protein
MNMKPLQVKGSTFGMVIRAARLGYHLSAKHGAFIRLCDVDETTVNVTLAPIDSHVPNSKPKTHYCWWEQKDADDPPLLDLIPALQNVRKVKKLISFDIDKETGVRIWS